MIVADYKLTRFATVVKSLPEVIECHRVTGAESRKRSADATDDVLVRTSESSRVSILSVYLSTR